MAAPTKDHVIPRSKGGSNGMSNLRLAHKGCNMAKGSEYVPVDNISQWVAEYLG